MYKFSDNDKTYAHGMTTTTMVSFFVRSPRACLFEGGGDDDVPVLLAGCYNFLESSGRLSHSRACVYAPPQHAR